MNQFIEIMSTAQELNNVIYTVEYKLPRQRKWRHGFSMKSKAGIDAALPMWRANMAVDNLCQSHKIKTRIV